MLKSKQEKARQEEIVRTQVLNLDELRRVASYERKTSKKPALFCAIIGTFMITVGMGAQGYISMETNALRAQQLQKNIIHRQEEKKEEEIIQTNETSLECVRIYEANENGTRSEEHLTFTFEDNKLVGETKVYIVDALENNTVGIKAAQDYYNAQKPLEPQNNLIEGYQISVTSRSDRAFTIITQIDFKTINLATVPGNIMSNIQIKPDFQLGETLENVELIATQNNYKCTKK